MREKILACNRKMLSFMNHNLYILSHEKFSLPKQTAATMKKQFMVMKFAINSPTNDAEELSSRN